MLCHILTFGDLLYTYPRMSTLQLGNADARCKTTVRSLKVPFQHLYPIINIMGTTAKGSFYWALCISGPVIFVSLDIQNYKSGECSLNNVECCSKDYSIAKKKLAMDCYWCCYHLYVSCLISNLMHAFVCVCR